MNISTMSYQKRRGPGTWSRRPLNDLRGSTTEALLTVIGIVALYCVRVDSASINYGVSHQPIKDISQLMPSLCQNQSVICEGSFCIPGLRKCVCDLRKPVQSGRFCLRQVEIETRCFVSGQCNHTVRGAVCVDLSSNVILDAESSKFKLEQWQQLNELRQASQSALSNGKDRLSPTTTSSTTTAPPVNMAVFMAESAIGDESNFHTRDDVIMSNTRNSPYEINYYTPELLQQNHTRRKTNSSDRAQGKFSDETLGLGDTQNDGSQPSSGEDKTKLPVGEPSLAATTHDTRTFSVAATNQLTATPSSVNMPTSSEPNIPPQAPSTSPIAPSTSLANELAKKKMVVKQATWPPGVCSCTPGYMFDSMLRRCLALSLADSHCLTDNDCRQIRMTHCSGESKKCTCDEPLEWNQSELACVRPKLKVASSTVPVNAEKPPLSNLQLDDVFADQSIVFSIWIALLIIGSLVFMTCIFFMFCSSSNKPAIISPKNQKHKKGTASNNLPKSPYATLRKPDKPAGPVNSLTQAARGRILNYDFEQDNPIPEEPSPRPPASTDPIGQRDQQPSSGTLNRNGTLTRVRGHKHVANPKAPTPEPPVANRRKTPEVVFDESVDLNELDSETKSEASILVPPSLPTNQPTYMLAGQQSAIAAAAAAVANRRNFGKPEFV